MKQHLNTDIGENYWTIRASTKNNAVDLVRVKIVDAEPNIDPIQGKRVLCATAKDPEEYKLRQLWDNSEAVEPFWTREIFLYTSVREAMEVLRKNIDDGVKEMADFFDFMDAKGTNMNTRNQIIQFSLDIIDVTNNDAQ